MRILITGVTGQDGSFLADQYIDKGHEVWGVARRTSTPNTGRIFHLLSNANFTLVQGDVCDATSMFRIIGDFQPERVLHMAAQSHVGTSFNQPSYTWDATAVGTLNVLEAIRMLSKDSRFYFAASSEMFGDQYSVDLGTIKEWGKDNGKRFQDENTRMHPQSPYGIAKLAGYHATRLYRNSYDLYACSGILFNHESERRGLEFVTRKITRYVAGLKHAIWKSQDIDDLLFGTSSVEDHPKLKLGNLTAKRDWGYAPDYMRGVRKIIEHERPDDFVLATGKTHTVGDFLKKIFELAVVDWTKWVEIDKSLFRPSEVPFLRGCAKKAEEKLGWVPEVGFDELAKIMLGKEIDRFKSAQKI